MPPSPESPRGSDSHGPALYKFFPDCEAMLEGALDLMIGRVPKWIDQSSGSDVFEHVVDMGERSLEFILVVHDSGTSGEIFRRMLGDVAGPSRDNHTGCAEDGKGAYGRGVAMRRRQLRE